MIHAVIVITISVAKVIKPKLPKGYKIDIEGLHLSYMDKKAFH